MPMWISRVLFWQKVQIHGGTQLFYSKGKTLNWGRYIYMQGPDVPPVYVWLCVFMCVSECPLVAVSPAPGAKWGSTA